jgi:glycosyltransferase involved in cell wall biosynthesis
VKLPTLQFVIKGDLQQRTGGYIYDAHIIRGLEKLGWAVSVHSTSSHSTKKVQTHTNLEIILDSIKDGQTVILDGLAMGQHPDELGRHCHRLKLISLLHHPLSEESGLSPSEKTRLLEVEMKALGTCTGVITTSQFTAKQLVDMNVAEKIVRTVIPGTDPVPCAKGPHNNTPPRLLCVASVIPRKGLDILVEALHQIQHLDWECICAGDLERSPHYASKILNSVSERHLNHRILFTGECSSSTIAKLYDLSSIFVLASRYEGYGMVLTEAVVRCLPVISTTGGAIPHTLNGTSAVLVPPGNANCLADAIKAALDSHSDNNHRSGKPKGAQSRFPTWDQTIQHFEEAIITLVPDICHP